MIHPTHRNYNFSCRQGVWEGRKARELPAGGRGLQLKGTIKVSGELVYGCVWCVEAERKRERERGRVRESWRQSERERERERVSESESGSG